MARASSAAVKAGAAPRKRSFPKNTNAVPPLLLALFAVLTLGVFSFLPRATANPRLQASFWGATAGLLILLVLLRRRLAAAGRAPYYEVKAVAVHWVQPLMQGAIYVYWGMYWPEVFRFAPLIAAQIVFAYALDMMVCWWRRDKWILGFGPLPIILSTNLFLWFLDDWFFLQFLMVATGVLGKEFIKWHRDGRLTHIFNPSALSLFVFSIGLLATHSTSCSWGGLIATTMARPDHMYLEIFLVGLVVQGLFSVTLVTLSAAATLFLMGLVYTHATGVYNFVDSNIPVSVFLGLHLLITDPATSPRRTLGKIAFGAMYGAGVFGIYPLLAWLDAPRFYDKLLFVPVLNLSVRALDRASAALEARIHWPKFSWNPRKANLGYMAVWSALFAVMTTTGFLGHSHPGDDPEFWHRACEAGRLHGCREWLNALKVSCHNGSAALCLTLGQIEDAGRSVPRDALDAGRNFGRACDLGLPGGCAALTGFVRTGGEQVFDGGCLGGDGVSCFVLGWLADKGMGVPQDPARAFALFQRSCDRGWARGCGALGECYRQGEGTTPDPAKALENYEKGCRGGHARSCFNAALMYRRGLGGPPDEALAEERRRQACELGLEDACRPR
jgi:hypothetical protein